jgi:hypothetical protein
LHKLLRGLRKNCLTYFFSQTDCASAAIAEYAALPFGLLACAGSKVSAGFDGWIAALHSVE